MSYGEVKQLCEEAWSEISSYHECDRLDGGEKCCICNESRKQDKVFKLVTDPILKKNNFAKESIIACFRFVNQSFPKNLSIIAFISAFVFLESLPAFF